MCNIKSCPLCGSDTKNWEMSENYVTSQVDGLLIARGIKTDWLLDRLMDMGASPEMVTDALGLDKLADEIAGLDFDALTRHSLRRIQVLAPEAVPRKGTKRERGGK